MMITSKLREMLSDREFFVYKNYFLNSFTPKGKILDLKLLQQIMIVKKQSERELFYFNGSGSREVYEKIDKAIVEALPSMIGEIDTSMFTIVIQEDIETRKVILRHLGNYKAEKTSSWLGAGFVIFLVILFSVLVVYSQGSL